MAWFSYYLNSFAEFNGLPLSRSCRVTFRNLLPRFCRLLLRLIQKNKVRCFYPFFTSLCVALCLLLVGHPVAAQSENNSGYIVALSGDTVRGLVNFRDSRQSGVACRFQATAGGAIRLYRPSQLRGYGLGKGAEAVVFRAMAVPARPAETTSRLVADSARLHFLEVLVRGPASLYLLRDKHQGCFYVQSPALPLTELLYNRAEVQGTRIGTAMEEQNTFRSTLATALAGCPVAQALLPRLVFKEAALVHAVAQYNSCTNPVPLLPARSRSRTGVVFGVVGGLQQGRMTISGTDFFAQVPTISQQGGVGGLFVSLTMPQTRQALTLRAELLYDDQLYETAFRSPSRGAITFSQEKSYKFDLTYLHLPLLLRYSFLHGMVRPFVEVGMVASRVLKAQTAFTIENSLGSFVNIPVFVNDVDENDFGLAAGAGLSSSTLAGRRLALSVRLASGRGPSNVANIGTSTTNLSFLLGLDLTKPRQPGK